MAPELIVVAVLGCLVAARRSARSPRVRLSTLSGRRGRRSGGPLVADAIGRVRRRRAGELAARQLPVLLDHVAWALRSGASVPQAFVRAADRLDGPLHDELAPCAASLRDGRSFDAALARWLSSSARRRDDPRRVIVGALRIAVVAGGAPAAALEGVAASVRDREAVRREARALTAQAVASAVLLVVAPLAFGVLLASGDAEVRHFLLADPIGLACLLAAAVLDVLGALWMRAVARVAR